MTYKILFWQTSDWFNYNLAYGLQHKDLELYAIIDVPNKPKKFFQEQKFINYKKIWFFHDHIKNRKKYDVAYLEKFEEKYSIDLWLLAYNERIFYNFNQYKKFQTDEVLSIIEQECRLFENVLDDIKNTTIKILSSSAVAELGFSNLVDIEVNGHLYH